MSCYCENNIMDWGILCKLCFTARGSTNNNKVILPIPPKPAKAITYIKFRRYQKQPAH